MSVNTTDEKKWCLHCVIQVMKDEGFVNKLYYIAVLY